MPGFNGQQMANIVAKQKRKKKLQKVAYKTFRRKNYFT